MRRIILSAALAFAAVAAAQDAGMAGMADPLAPGYLFRASIMLAADNPLGAINQTDADLPAFDSLSPEMQAEWLALRGSAQFERGNEDCLATLALIPQLFPTSPRSTQALLTIGDWHWLHAQWHEAIDSYLLTDIDALSPERCLLYKYRLALAYLNCGLPGKSVALFSEIARSNDYAVAAQYYLAYIDYLKGDYDRAYSEMETLLPHSGQGIEPLCYMAQIEYLRGDYDAALRHSKELLGKRPVAALAPEINRIAGLSLFKKGDFDGARPFLQKFLDATEEPNDDAVYAMGAILYADGEFDRARPLLRKLTDRNNDLAQGAYLYLGQIAEQTGDSKAAAMAFSKAASMPYDAMVAETALYNHITALTHGGNAPFSSSISLFENFLSAYPDSPYASDVEESLAAAFFHDNNYEKALQAIERVKDPSDATLATRQKILYKLGMGMLSAGRASEAAAYLRDAASMKAGDAVLAAESRLWLAEALMAQDDWKEAAGAFRAALKGRLSPANRIPARYGLAYSLFKSNDWKSALKEFEAVAEDAKAPADLRADALIREADCLLYTGQYDRAAAKYLKAASQTVGDPDYAAFRHAVAIGVRAGTDAKMKELTAFLNQRPGSAWTSEVLLEAGKTMAALDRPDKAAPFFERLTAEYPKDSRSRMGALSLAESYMKQRETSKAENVYKEIIRQWPTSEEALTASDEMRRIAAADNRLPEYAAFLDAIDGAPKIDPDEMDAIVFDAAETAYADNTANTAQLEKYVAQFPDGRFLANALMDLAEAADAGDNPSRALAYLEDLLRLRADAPQVPAALFLQGQLLENAGRTDDAFVAYTQLEKRGGADFLPEATAGIMRTTPDAAQRVDYARRLLQTGGATAEDADEARFYEASGMLRTGSPERGVEALTALAATPDNLSGAKAAVELGEWYIAQGDAQNALKTLEAFTEAGSIHAYWLARGFIALADAYHASGNDYLAAEYLKSLRDNYPGDEFDIEDGIAARLQKYSK